MPPLVLKRAATLLRAVENMIDIHFIPFSVVLLTLNLAACVFVIQRVPYTEIDWRAYMEEVSGVIKDKELDYKLLKGGTGPLVYPAGFVYIYSLLYALTDNGVNIHRAQYIFAGLHTLTLALVLTIYRLCHTEAYPRKFPLWTVGFLFLSRRVMSLFVLRLFNDCIQTLLMYAAIIMFIYNRWGMGSLLYSLSVSVKMNALLYAPGLAVLLCQARGTGGCFRQIVGICLTIQVILGAPFLIHAPSSYLSRAFELTREFLYKWSVNGAFLEETAFLDKKLALGLLGMHLGVLFLFGHKRWTSAEHGGLSGLLQLDRITSRDWLRRLLLEEKKTDLSANHVVTVLFTSNFIGIVFARTLHYQFYVWYAHTIVFLIMGGMYAMPIKVAIILAIEMVFNVYPPHPTAAIVLHLSHVLILVSLWTEARASRNTVFKSNKSDKRT